MSRTNWLSSFPSTRPSSSFTTAASSLIAPSASINRRGKRGPSMGKLSKARRVCAPNSASRGTSTSPIESRSIRCGVVSCCVISISSRQSGHEAPAKRDRSRHIIQTSRTHYTRGDGLNSSRSTLRHALKEWAVAVAALERGDTALVVRKGGIREKSFAVPEARFFLFKSYEHQKEDQLKPAYHDLLDFIPDRPDDGPVVLTSFAEVAGAYEVSEVEELEALDPHHVWTHEYAESRQ